ncbi:transcriptional repressor [bacterium]|nr:transcriptional repressor [bacterium]
MSCNHPHPPQEALRERIRSCGLKITPSRLLALEVLENDRCLLSVDDLIQRMRQKNRKLKADWTTIYRTLQSFRDAGLVESTLLEDGVTRYEFRCEEPGNAHHHHHVRCNRCGRISPIDVCEIRKIEKAIEALGYTGLTHRLEFSGICGSCKKT